MRNPDLDLPLETTAFGRFLLWLTAGLVFLCVLAFAVAAIADAQLTALRQEPRIVTVALPPNPEPAAARREVDDVLAHVRALPGVAYASLIDEAAFGELVDELLVDALAASDMGCLEAGRIAAYVGDGHLERGHQALDRLRAALTNASGETA